MRFARRCTRSGVVALAVAACGCVDYHWELDPHRAVARAQEERKDLFLYFRAAFSPQCGRMEREVLYTPEVVELFQNSVNCQLELFWFSNLAARYGVAGTPSYVIRRPDGRQQVRTGYLPKEHFIAFAKSALSPPPPPAPKKAADRSGR